MKNKREKRYLLLTYFILFLSAIIMLLVMLSFFFLRNESLRLIIQTVAFVLGCIDYSALILRQIIIGRKVRMAFYLAVLVILIIITVTYIYKFI